MITGAVSITLNGSGMTAGPVNEQTEPPTRGSRARVSPDTAKEQLKDVLAEHNITLRFSQDETTKSIVVQLVDATTGEEVIQIPTEVSLHLAATFLKLQGQFIDERQ